MARADARTGVRPSERGGSAVKGSVAPNGTYEHHKNDGISEDQ